MIVPQVKPPVNLFFEKNVRIFSALRGLRPMWYPVSRQNAPYRRLFLPWKGDHHAHHGHRLRRRPHRHRHLRPHRPAGRLHHRHQRLPPGAGWRSRSHFWPRSTAWNGWCWAIPSTWTAPGGPARKRPRPWRQLLEETTGLPVVLWDERRTTIDAHQILMNSGKNAKKRKKVVDAVAASLILEGYLTYLKSAPGGIMASGPGRTGVRDRLHMSLIPPPLPHRRCTAPRRAPAAGTAAAPADRRKRSARKTPWGNCRPPSGARRAPARSPAAGRSP